MIKSADEQLPPPTVLAYRVYPDGKQELVRGVQLAEFSIRAWKEALGISRELIEGPYGHGNALAGAAGTETPAHPEEVRQEMPSQCVPV